jgi:hypothetical protein
MSIKVGKPYWAIRIKNEALLDSMSWPEYRDLRKQKQAAAAKILGNCFDFANEQQAIRAKKKLPKDLQEWATLAELTPISLGLGWI